MNKIYIIKLDNEIIGETRFEKSDPPMGIVFGKIINLKKEFNYSFRNDVAIDVQILGSLFFYHS